MPTFVKRVEDNRVLIQVAAAVQVDGSELDHRFMALVDTGATVTAVTSRLAAQVGVDPVGRSAFVPASGDPVETNLFGLHLSIPVDPCRYRHRWRQCPHLCRGWTPSGHGVAVPTPGLRRAAGHGRAGELSHNDARRLVHNEQLVTGHGGRSRRSGGYGAGSDRDEARRLEGTHAALKGLRGYQGDTVKARRRPGPYR